MTTGYWLNTATKFLESKAIATARLDCLVLLEDVMHLNRAQLLAEPNTEMKQAQVELLQKLLVRRSKHEPLAYIRAQSEFYGRNFVVSDAVLVPRPESETIIDLLKDLPDLPARPFIVDVGTGGGALGISAALELENAQVELLEIDEKALEVAKTNVVMHATAILATQSDLLQNMTTQPDVLLCNLPYVPDEYQINRAAKHEPALALFAGPDGLDLYRKLFEEVQNLQKRPLFILSEALPAQHEALATLAADSGYTLQQTDDFIQVFRAEG